MKVDSVITIEDNLNYLLIDKASYNNENYFLAVLLNEDEEPTDSSVVLKEIKEDNEYYVEKVVSDDLLIVLTGLFTKNLNEYIDGLPNEV